MFTLGPVSTHVSSCYEDIDLEHFTIEAVNVCSLSKDNYTIGV